MSERAKILCVDDEVEVLRGLALHLGRRYEVLTATCGADALKLLEQDPRVEVIISDMRMPGLSGSEFLSQSRAFAPEAQRILLTGQTDLASAISAINEGQIFRFLTKPCPSAELISTIEAALERHRARALEHTTVRRKLQHQQLQIDPLTGLASRLQLMAVLEAAAFEVTEAVSAVVAYYIAIDGSDEPVANRDQPWGDELAKIIAERLKLHCSDATVIACWGTEQFVVVVSSAGASNLELCARGEELLAALIAPIPGRHVAVGASVGIARLVDRQQWQRLIQQAATAADEARHEQRSCVCLYQPEAPPRAERQRELVHALREALVQDGLHLHYQPIVDIKESRVRGLECLARWERGTLGNIVPTTFIPLAEHSGDIVRLGQWVLWRACHEGRQIIGDRLEVAVNVSAKQLMDKSFLPHLEKCLSHSGLAPESLELELTESALAIDMERLREILEETRRLKVRIAVDDFGTGYSSLSYLSRLPIDLIKVDQTFVRDFNQGGKTIIKAALNIARDFGLEVIIEGVETSEMLQQVRDLGASLIQGYWFAKPMPAAQVPGWLREFECNSAKTEAAAAH
jgi:predicted signal transduction protein with EAL and GGDEF domain